MTRYFFHVLGQIRWEDEEGEEHPDLPAAYQCAVERLGALDREAPGKAKVDVSIQVTSGAGHTLFAVSAGQLLSPFPAPPGYWLH
jgi:hypothetical protein